MNTRTHRCRAYPCYSLGIDILNGGIEVGVIRFLVFLFSNLRKSHYVLIVRPAIFFNLHLYRL